jgi:C-terminal processing protease CtpA/Prc
VESRRLGTDISYLRFDAFGDDAFMAPVFKALDEAGPAGLILDLRWNGGGFTHQLQRVAGVLLADGVLLGTLQNSKGIEPMTASAAAKRYAGPLVVIIGPSTGSSSEILAAAVRDYKRGQLVGRMTNGSSLVSQGFPLPDGGVARVPITDFRTSTEQRIEGVGVVPDIRVMSTLEDARAGRDPAVERALSLLQAN